MSIRLTFYVNSSILLMLLRIIINKENGMIKERNTKQKELVINALKNHKDKHLTAEGILENIKKVSKDISQATVYRILSQLSTSGVVRKYIGADNKKACYQYVDSDNKCNMHYHLICDKCGQTIHYENSEVEKLRNSILKEKGFEANLQKVVFYGICKECLGDK